MPQLEQLASTYASQLFWLLICFGVLYFGIARAMLPKVGKVVEGRQAKIAADIASAEAATKVAREAEDVSGEGLRKARAEAFGLTAAAKATAAADVAAQLKTLDDQLAAQATDAEAKLAAAKAASLAEIDGIAAETAAAIVEKLTGLATSPAETAAAVTAVKG